MQVMQVCVPLRNKMFVHLIPIVTQQLLASLDLTSGEDPNNFSPPRMLHVTIPAVWFEAVVDFMSKACFVLTCILTNLKRNINVVGVIAVYLNLVHIVQQLLLT